MVDQLEARNPSNVKYADTDPNFPNLPTFTTSDHTNMEITMLIGN